MSKLHRCFAHKAACISCQWCCWSFWSRCPGLEAVCYFLWCGFWWPVQRIGCVARKIATSNVDPNRLAAYTACHLIALNKNPGIRPIGVGEAAHRIIGKAILKVIKPRLEGHRKSTAMRRSRSGCWSCCPCHSYPFKDESTDAALLLDASNAFNRLNWQVALRNFQNICPTLAIVATNLYWEESKLFIDGEILLTGGCYSGGGPFGYGHVWCWDHAPDTDTTGGLWWTTPFMVCWRCFRSVTGSLNSLRSWWDKMVESGPSYIWLLCQFIKDCDYCEGGEIRRSPGLV